MVIVILTVFSHPIATYQENNQCRAPHAFVQPQICVLVFRFSVLSVLFLLGAGFFRKQRILDSLSYLDQYQYLYAI